MIPRPLVPRWPLFAGIVLSCCLGLQGDEPSPPPAMDPEIHITVRAASESPRIFAGVSDDSPGDQLVNDALRTIVSIRCRDIPIRRFAAELERAFQVPVRLDASDPTGDPVDPEMRVSIEVYGMSLTEAIGNLEATSSLEPSIERGMLVIRTVGRELRQNLLYDITPLRAIGVERVVNLIRQTTSGPWDEDEPGTGLITVIGHGLLIRADCRTHRQIERFLAMLSQHVSFLAPAPAAAPGEKSPKTGSGS